MTLRLAAYVECNTCQATYGSMISPVGAASMSPSAIHAAAHAAGWRRNGPLDTCPDCQKGDAP